MLRALFAAGRYQDVAAMADAALEASGTDYNVYVPITNALDALGKKDALEQMRQREIQALENHLKTVPEDARARAARGGDYAATGRTEEAMREATSRSWPFAPTRPTVLYNAACVFCQLGRKAEALGRAAQGLGRRLHRPRLGTARSRPGSPPRRPRVRAALPGAAGGA